MKGVALPRGRGGKEASPSPPVEMQIKIDINNQQLKD